MIQPSIHFGEDQPWSSSTLLSFSPPFSSAFSLLRFRSFLRAAEFLARKLAWLPVAVVAADLVDVGRMKNQGQVHGRAKESVLRLIRGLLSSLLRQFVTYFSSENVAIMRQRKELSSRVCRAVGEKAYVQQRTMILTNHGQ